MKKTAFVLMAVLVASVMLFAIDVEPVKAVTVTVPDDCLTIQEAINTANAGDTILVKSGTYYENVVVNKTLSIFGEDESTTVIDGKGEGTTVQVAADHVTFSGFTVQHSSAGYSLSGALSGIQVYRSSGNNINHNTLRNNYVGISLREASNNILTANSAYDNEYNFAVDVTGDGFSQFDNNVDASNTVDGKSIYYLKGESNLILGAESNAGAVYLINCRNITIEDLFLTRNYHGVFLWNTTNSYVRNVTATDNCNSGIRLQHCRNNTIIRNNLRYQAWHGISLVNSQNNSIIENHASGNWNEGIYSIYSTDNRIVSNVLSYSMRGLYLADSDNTYVLDNLFTADGNGALIFSFNCTILENVFKGNSVAMDVSGANNVIYHNNFIQNAEQIFPVNQFKNTWDNGYPSGGNYWSDYTGTDAYSGPFQNATGSDGIGDAPYVIETNNQDRYPLMKLHQIPVAVNARISAEPIVLNLKWAAKWVTACIELPEGYNVADIDVSTVILNGTIPAELTPTAIGDYDNDHIYDLMIEFNRTAVSALILSQGIIAGNVTLTINGNLTYGKSFEGKAVIRVKMPGDINGDAKVDILDLAIVSRAFGSYLGQPRWNPATDENEDGRIDIKDIALVARNFGKTYP